ncbi:hypothetical protein I316_00627 [Kwoniella heveanensis BCC8398]|uniref:Uncharacterized protein n=1 Tax=Kwoniella heveanensis BCC8398 TaxID=1296120 RepID=A0A1B9H2L0_9TREE|nr:hypothetical protein I316_00627 [Kwoniella heveanensis BCC8398]
MITLSRLFRYVVEISPILLFMSIFFAFTAVVWIDPAKAVILGAGLFMLAFVHEQIEDLTLSSLTPEQRRWLGGPVTEFWLFAVLSLLCGLYNEFRDDEDKSSDPAAQQQTGTPAQQPATPVNPQIRTSNRRFKRVAKMRKAFTEWGLAFFIGFSANGLTARRSADDGTCGDYTQVKSPGKTGKAH